MPRTQPHLSGNTTPLAKCRICTFHPPNPSDPFPWALTRRHGHPARMGRCGSPLLATARVRAAAGRGGGPGARLGVGGTALGGSASGLRSRAARSLRAPSKDPPRPAPPRPPHSPPYPSPRSTARAQCPAPTRAATGCASPPRPAIPRAPCRSAPAPFPTPCVPAPSWPGPLSRPSS